MLGSLLTRPGSTPAALLDALARRLGAAGVAADVLTHAALACGVGAGALFWLDRGWLALLALAVSGLLDAVDGRVARLGPGPTPTGGARSVDTGPGRRQRARSVRQAISRGVKRRIFCPVKPRPRFTYRVASPSR